MDIEANRLQRRVANDIVLLRGNGTCPGVENYSRHLGLRDEGGLPDTLLDYFGLRRDDDGGDTRVTSPSPNSGRCTRGIGRGSRGSCGTGTASRQP